MKSVLLAFAKTNALTAIWTARAKAYTLAVPAALKRIGRFPNTFFGPGVKLIGVARMRIGRNSVVGSGTWLNVNDLKRQGDALIVGENCFIGQDNFVTVGSKVTIRDYCLTTRGCSFIGSGHIYSNPFKPYASTGTILTDEIYIGVNCFFGLQSRVVGNVRIGHGCVVGAGAEVREDVPPFSLVIGTPSRVVKRFDVTRGEWIRWPATEYSEGPDEAEYLARIQGEVRWLVHPVTAAVRGAFDLT